MPDAVTHEIPFVNRVLPLPGAKAVLSMSALLVQEVGVMAQVTKVHFILP
jgi:hypothetical protein